MLVVGVGIGLVMQVLVLVVQNDARPQDIGVATSTATFFRSVGGSFGVAIFGAIFAIAARRPAGAAAGARSRRTSAAASTSTRSRREHLPPAVHADFLHAFAHALHGVFLWGMLIAVVPFAALVAAQGGAAANDARTRTAELSAEQAACGGTPDERQVVTERDTAAQHS